MYIITYNYILLYSIIERERKKERERERETKTYQRLEIYQRNIKKTYSYLTQYKSHK